MEEIIDLIATDSAASEVTDKLKDILFTKSAERIETQRPNISTSMFDEPQVEDEVEDQIETEGELETEPEEETD
tara:strand:+ start:383 stop:604 length:222 start_codon:yes stop_codon:yes gene_type:complete